MYTFIWHTQIECLLHAGEHSGPGTLQKQVSSPLPEAWGKTQFKHCSHYRSGGEQGN